MKNNALSDGKINSLKPQKAKDGTLKDTIYRDGSGLYLLVTAAGSKIWKLDFHCLKVRDSMTLGNILPFP
ncbi:Arm DNA-binding domain-containing protein [Mailhella sp.]|uniref:Arm DNA-binding domain-containing protein n=1 Tax=Mailhella sp. TaxID=1981029 RepID=UPI004063768A